MLVKTLMKEAFQEDKDDGGRTFVRGTVKRQPKNQRWGCWFHHLRGSNLGPTQTSEIRLGGGAKTDGAK